MIFQELGKLKRTTIMASIVMMATGIIMIICPEAYVDSLMASLGYIMLVVATVMVLDFISAKGSLADFVSLGAAIIIGLFGLAVIVFNNNVPHTLGWIFGILLIVDGLHSVFHALMYSRRAQRKGWWVLLVLSALLILFGLIIFFNPWWNSPNKLLDVIGGTMILSSVVGILRILWVWPIRKEEG